PHLPGAADLGVLVLIVVFIPDLADDFLDDVLDGDDAGGTAVLVRDEDQLRTGGTHALQDGLPAQAFRNGGDGAGEAFDGGRRQSLRLQRDRVLDVDDADRVVQIATGNGETGVAGLHCEQDQLVGGVLLIQRLDGGTRRHDVVGGDVPESQGTV